jgi:hypothetical protein
MWMEHGKKHGADIDIFGSISYYYNDIAVPAKFVLQPDTVTFDEVVQHPNVEVRYVGLRIIGYEKLMEKAKFIHSDKERNMDLFQLKVDETSTPVTLLRVVNSTPDPDGTYKNYFLSVPSDMTNCQQAVAWTFGMQPDEYHPQMET